ncbi:acyl carrier protein [Prevotella sp. oral taxon 376]|uniref:acyl carrier protein n=1 Tax=Prevotella sp. oral taxon 376 TaxID=712466 RepID=UPI000D1E3A62|nr:acyl carrier protein [Prevotella sp. oral taxon 376]PTL33780.1 acyl carrier protein [Prevotella sp. oral taxon 376]
MEKEEILKKLNGIFQTVLSHQDLKLEYTTSADDVDGWDSLAHMTIISEIEKRYDIHFKLRDIIKLHSIGDLCDIILKKVESK